jgi:hypothetical protein
MLRNRPRPRTRRRDRACACPAVGCDAELTVSAAVADAMGLTGGGADPDRVMAELEAILRRAKLQGRNRVERGDRPTNAESSPTST